MEAENASPRALFTLLLGIWLAIGYPFLAVPRSPAQEKASAPRFKQEVYTSETNPLSVSSHSRANPPARPDRLVVGIPYEDVRNIIDAGGVQVFNSSAAGILPDDDVFWSQDIPALTGIAEAGDTFGWVIATGDFNGDGYDDLAVGIRDEDTRGQNNAGAVQIIYGTPDGLTTTGNQLWDQGVAGMEDNAEAGDAFGAALAVGDFNGDGYDDLAIGVPGEDVDGAQDAGAVHILFGSENGLTVSDNQIWHQGTRYGERAEPGDGFGARLAVGDFDGDGYDDLAVGVPGEDVGPIRDAGSVHIFYGPAGRFSGIWHQESTDIEDSAEPDDWFGDALAAGDFNGDGYDDLAIGVPGEDIDSINNAGAVHVLYGSSLGIHADGNELWHQNVADVEGVAEAGDVFGRALSAGDLNGDGYDDLAIGIPLEDVGNVADAGAVQVLYGTSRGLSAAFDQLLDENATSAEGGAQEDDRFGYALAIGDFNNDGYADLAVGIPYKDTPVEDAGAVQVIFGSEDGLKEDVTQYWHQDTAGVDGASEPRDRFGFSLAVLSTASQARALVREPASQWFTTWTYGGGFLYWAQICSVEFPHEIFIKRRSAQGPNVIRRADFVASACRRALGMVADEEGLYYYRAGRRAIIVHPVNDFQRSRVLLDLSPNMDLKGGTHLAATERYVFWITQDDRILRVSKDGEQVHVVATTGPRATDLVATADRVFWLDDLGLRTASLTCGYFPCPASTLYATRGNYLVYQRPALPGHILYWVDQQGNRDRILRQQCTYVTPTSWSCEEEVLYTAPTEDWRIGRPAADPDGQYLFWREQFSQPGIQNARLMRLSLSSRRVEEVVIMRGYVDQDVFADDRYVYFARGLGIVLYQILALPIDAQAIQRNIRAQAWEITQGIQSLANDVPLVAGKPTYVRVFATGDPPLAGVEARLYGTRDGVPLPGSPLSPLNGARPVGSGFTVRADPDEGWLFRLPPEWTQPGTIRLEAVVDPDGIYPDTNRADNRLEGAFTFRNKALSCIVFVPVHTHEPPISIDRVANFGPMIDLFQRLWPTPDTWIYELTSIGIAGGSGDWINFAIVAFIDPFTDDPDECEDAGANPYFVGMVDSRADMDGVNGQGMYDIHVAWVKMPANDETPAFFGDWNFPGAGVTLAHELSHNEGRYHVLGCADPDDPDRGYPYPDGRLDYPGADRHFGFDTAFHTPIPPNAAGDLMSYCRPRWMSDYTWKAILNKLPNAPSAQAAGAVQGVDLSAASQVVLAAGVITPTVKQGQLTYAWAYPTQQLSAGMFRKWQRLAASPAEAAPAATGAETRAQYLLRLVDPAGRTLAEYPVSPARMEESDVQPFVLTFPAPADTVARIELWADGALLDALAPNTGVPTVRILQPRGGETFTTDMTIEWEASDPDGDPLRYIIQYSPDNGTTWYIVASNEPMPSANRATVRLDSLRGLPGSLPNGGRIRVAVSDGYNTALAVSAGFTVADQAPRAYILSPRAGQPQPPGRPVIVRGGATDPEDGGLRGDALTWSVDGRDAGTGTELTLAGLAPGDYEVTLTARDSRGNTASDRQTLTILPLDIPQTAAPVLDGACDDSVYGEGASVSLKPYADGTQATAYLVRANEYLWVCFTGLKRRPALEGQMSFVGIRVDVNYSRDDWAQPDDYGFFLSEDGSPLSYAGDGVGGFAQPGPGGLVGRVRGGVGANAGWQAELRIDADVFGGWNRVVGMNLGHYWVRWQGDDYHWPFDSGWNQPFKWAKTILGSLPQLTALEPISATVGTPGLTLTVRGRNFEDGAQVLWDGTPLPTVFGDATRLMATVDAARLSAAGVITITVRNPGGEAFVSNGLPFQVRNPVPVITGLSPDSAPQGGAGFTLTVNGADFVPGAVVYWDKTPLSTTFVSSAQLQTMVDRSFLRDARAVRITVLNPGPGGGTSNGVRFVVRAEREKQKIFLPVILR